MTKRDVSRYFYKFLNATIYTMSNFVSYFGNLVHFACFRKHIGLYPGPEAVEEFREQLRDYKTSKGTIHLPYDKESVIDALNQDSF